MGEREWWRAMFFWGGGCDGGRGLVGGGGREFVRIGREFCPIRYFSSPRRVRKPFRRDEIAGVSEIFPRGCGLIENGRGAIETLNCCEDSGRVRTVRSVWPHVMGSPCPARFEVWSPRNAMMRLEFVNHV